MTRQYCGLCKVAVNDWRKHVASERHKQNLLDANKLKATLQEHQEGVERRRKGGER